MIIGLNVGGEKLERRRVSFETAPGRGSKSWLPAGPRSSKAWRRARESTRVKSAAGLPGAGHRRIDLRGHPAAQSHGPSPMYRIDLPKVWALQVVRFEFSDEAPNRAPLRPYSTQSPKVSS
jgi:hypothetical protein